MSLSQDTSCLHVSVSGDFMSLSQDTSCLHVSVSGDIMTLSQATLRLGLRRLYLHCQSQEEHTNKRSSFISALSWYIHRPPEHATHKIKPTPNLDYSGAL